MKEKKKTINKVARYASKFITTVLRVDANTASSGVVYQPKAPEKLKDFSKVR